MVGAVCGRSRVRQAVPLSAGAGQGARQDAVGVLAVGVLVVGVLAVGVLAVGVLCGRSACGRSACACGRSGCGRSGCGRSACGRSSAVGAVCIRPFFYRGARQGARQRTRQLAVGVLVRRACGRSGVLCSAV